MRFLIVANGPFLTKNIVHELAKKKTVLALDGAADKLAKIGIMPSIILGDFDSVNESGNNHWGIKETFSQLQEKSVPYIGNYNVKIVPVKNQDLTDLAKAVHYCDQHHAQSIDIVCAVGGRFDHTLSNIRLLRAEHRRERPICLYTEGQVLTFAKDETIYMHGEVGDYCGIVAAPAGKFSSDGLAYNGDNYELNYGFTESTSNQLEKRTAKISIVGEALIVHPAQLEAQRKFLKMSYRDQLFHLQREQQLVLHEPTAEELRNAKIVRETLKKILSAQNLSLVFKQTASNSPNDNVTSYLNYKKSDVYDAKVVPGNEKVLVSMPEKKYHAFRLFKNMKAEDIKKKDIRELIEIFEEISPEEIQRSKKGVLSSKL